MPALTPAQNESLVKRGADILEEAGKLTSGADPNYIRDAQPDGLFEALPLAAARQGCRRYADKGGDYPPLRAARAERACRPYLDSLGYGEPPSLTLPFRGGQCYGALYRVITAFNNPPLGAQTNEQEVAARVIGTYRGDLQPNQLIPVGIELQVTAGGPVTRLNITSLPAEFVGTFRIQSVIRVDGGNDDCGNPTPEYEPPQPPPLPGPIREPFTIAPGIDVDIAVEVNIDGSIDIDFGTGPVTIDPFDEPDGGGGDGGDGGDDVPPGYQGEPGSPVDVGPGGAADETDPTRNLVGVLVQTIETPPRANQVFNQTETYTKGAYFVYFGGDGGLTINPEAAITVQDQFFYAPEGANRFRVVPNVGFTLRATPFYKEDT